MSFNHKSNTHRNNSFRFELLRVFEKAVGGLVHWVPAPADPAEQSGRLVDPVLADIHVLLRNVFGPALEE